MTKKAVFVNRRIAVVTGAASGLGRNIAERLARDHQVVIADLNAARAERTATELSGKQAKVHHVPLDVTDEASVKSAFEKIEAEIGPVEVLVNNAGIFGQVKRMESIDLNEFRRVLAVNLEGVFLCTKAVLSGMRQRKKGVVVTIASTGGKEAPAFTSPYAASKAAVIAVTKSWAKEVAREGIRVNCVSPTLIGQSGMEGELPPEFRAGSISQIPMGRPARLEEISAVVAFLVSDEASFVTGQCYDISGGRSVF